MVLYVYCIYKVFFGVFIYVENVIVIFFEFYCKCGLFFINRCMLFVMNYKKKWYNVVDVVYGFVYVMNEIVLVFFDY